MELTLVGFIVLMMRLSCCCFLFFPKILTQVHFILSYRVVGLKGMQPRAADTTATVHTIFIILLTNILKY